MYIALLDLSPDHHLRIPLPIEVTQDAQGATVSDRLFSRFGQGTTRSEAINDYAADVLDYFATLRQNRERLSPRLASHLELLESIIRTPPAAAKP